MTNNRSNKGPAWRVPLTDPRGKIVAYGFAGPEQELVMTDSIMKIGNKARAFTLKNQDDEKVSLRDFGGRWVVLYFYPRDDTPGCTTEACQFTTSLSDFESLDAVVLGVSPDSTEKHKKFIEKHGLKIALLSDPDHVVMEKYAAWGEKVRYGKTSVGVLRSTALIDPNGRLAWHWANVRADGHAEKVRDKLKELRSRLDG